MEKTLSLTLAAFLTFFSLQPCMAQEAMREGMLPEITDKDLPLADLNQSHVTLESKAPEEALHVKAP